MSNRSIDRLISLEGKRALVTGSAMGIGKAIATRLAEAGAELLLVDIDEKNLELTQAKLNTSGYKTAAHRVDLSNKSNIDQLWRTIQGEAPDILVNNAGIYPLKDFLELDEALLEKVLSVNLKAVVWMSQNMIRRREYGGGVIINVSSIEAILPFKRDLVHYDSGKAGVLGLTRALAKEYGSKGFRINAIIPGGVITPGTKGVAKELLRGNIEVAKSGIEFRSRLPMGRFGSPDEVARVALFLASDLSSYVTGTFIVVDGGFLSA